MGILSWVTLLPVLGMIVVLLLPKDNKQLIRWTSVGFTAFQLLISIFILMNFNKGMAGINTAEGFQFVEKANWMTIKGVSWFGTIDIDYYIGIDGLSVMMVFLTALISLVATISSFTIEKSVKGYFALLLLLDTGMMGTFVALDFFLFYVFWEVMLLPMYFLIGIWGGPRREYAAIKFFLYTLAGSVLMLLVIIALYFSVSYVDPTTGEKVHTFNMLLMMNPANYDAGSIMSGIGTWMRYLGFLGMFIGFAIKVPMFPFHTWLPDAHVEAPTAISVILAGVLLKLGTYGMLRICYPIFPDATAWFAVPLGIFAAINIVYGALVAMAQEDFKKLIAYSSISHMGVVLLGMAAMNTQGITGAVMQMFNHGTVTAMLFLIVGVIYDRAHTRGLYEFGGLMNKMPKYSGVMTIAFFAALGLPGLSGFISEAFSFLGAFQSTFERDTMMKITIFSTLGIVLTAGYMLWTLQRVFLGSLPEKWNELTDIDTRELVMLVPLAIIVIFLGIYPSPMIDMMTTSINALVEVVKNGSGVTSAMLGK
jgi:NADH-quinone oxidoreductase subunit M